MAVAVALLWIAFAADAYGAEEHVLDPTLSLTGATGVTALDPVPDPGPAHPRARFSDPCGVTTDAYGDIYVGDGAVTAFSEGKIAIFDSAGKFITEIGNEHWPCTVAVDSGGRLYVYENATGKVVRFDPVTYEPEAGEISYEEEPTIIAGATPPGARGVAVDPSNDHVYISYDFYEGKYKIEERLPDGTLVEPPIVVEDFDQPVNLTIRGASGDIHVTGHPFEPFEGQAYVLDGTTHEVKLTLPDDSDMPGLDFGFTFGRGGIAVDQETGDIYVDAIGEHHAVYQFGSDGHFIGKIELPGNGLKSSEPFNGIAVDSGEHSPNKGYVYVTSGFQSTNSHLYAFKPRELGPPEVRGARLVQAGEEEALVEAEVNPHDGDTSYRFEYGAEDCSTHPCQVVAEGELKESSSFKAVSASIEGLEPGTSYHFRVVATNHCNPADEEEECVVEGEDVAFSTFAGVGDQSGCPNAPLRTGPSAALADCRAYELVSPPETNGRIPTGASYGTGNNGAPAIPLARPDGQSVLFGTEGGSLPGSGGSGFYDTFRSTRTASGWQTAFAGLKGTEAQEPYPGGVSADHRYSLWLVEKGTLADGQYLRGPDGSVEEVGIGSEGETPSARGRWLSEDGAHLIFSSSAHLEPDAPPAGIAAVYDRSPEGPTRVVSLKPGDEPVEAGEVASYLGATPDGNAVAFRLPGTIYVRLDNAATLEVTEEPATYGGIADDGSRVFYLKGGDAFAFETASEEATMIGEGGESTLVNVSADGSAAYFLSPLVLDGAANGHGDGAQPEVPNLYRWDADIEAVRFIATVTEEDAEGEGSPAGGSSGLIGGLGLWASDAVAPEQGRFTGPANDSSRTTPDGQILAFESRARLTDYDSEGHSEVYRYDAGTDRLTCVSCNPTGARATSEARLQSRYAPLLSSTPPVNALSQIHNLALDGETVLFQSADRLSPMDPDGRIDVYEWQSQGTRACKEPTGCIRLISSGQSRADDYLYGASEDGSSVFFVSSDRLVPEDTSSTPSIYAARMGGGFAPEAVPEECEGEGCQGALLLPGQATTPVTADAKPSNPKSRKHRRCPKSKRKVRRKGKTRCVRRRAKHHRARAGRRAVR